MQQRVGLTSAMLAESQQSADGQSDTIKIKLTSTMVLPASALPLGWRLLAFPSALGMERRQDRCFIDGELLSRY